ncbi:MAG: carbon storage regulator [Planctomycetaceae bacterium]|nr:carbon storage regulator [Planctomycetaceae bacterium]MBT6497333.1 carbon storage regulator [Planctomycetaceae bacterium]
MLVLSRKLGEAIKISDNITVRLVKVGNGRVRLGIEAPPEISISRMDAPAPTVDNRTDIGHLQPTVSV